MPKERLLGQNHQRNQIYLHSTKPKILIGYSIAITKTDRQSNLWINQLLLGALVPLILNATYRNIIYSCILVSLSNYEIFQTSILFETNKFHHGGPPYSGGPGQLPPLSPLNPALGVQPDRLKTTDIWWVTVIFPAVQSTRAESSWIECSSTYKHRI